MFFCDRVLISVSFFTALASNLCFSPCLCFCFFLLLDCACRSIGFLFSSASCKMSDSDNVFDDIELTPAVERTYLQERRQRPSSVPQQLTGGKKRLSRSAMAPSRKMMRTSEVEGSGKRMDGSNIEKERQRRASDRERRKRQHVQSILRSLVDESADSDGGQAEKDSSQESVSIDGSESSPDKDDGGKRKGAEGVRKNDSIRRKRRVVESSLEGMNGCSFRPIVFIGYVLRCDRKRA